VTDHHEKTKRHGAASRAECVEDLIVDDGICAARDVVGGERRADLRAAPPLGPQREPECWSTSRDSDRAPFSASTSVHRRPLPTSATYRSADPDLGTMPRALRPTS